MAINTYLADKYKPELLGLNAEVRGQVHQWNMWSSLELQPPFIEIFIQTMFVPEEKRSQEVIDKAMAKLPGVFTILNNALGKSPYLAGPEFTVADLNAASVASISQMVGFDTSSYSHVNKWLAELAKRPAFQKYMELRKSK